MKEFFTDDNGKLSMGRLTVCIALIVSLVLVGFGIWQGCKKNIDAATLFLTIGAIEMLGGMIMKKFQKDSELPPIGFEEENGNMADSSINN